MSNVNSEECETCQFYPGHCHYWDNEGANLSFLIANFDGTCQKRRSIEEGDWCVICGEETPYKTDTPIGMREHYVEGAGQLCERCWIRIYERG